MSKSNTSSYGTAPTGGSVIYNGGQRLGNNNNNNVTSKSNSVKRTPIKSKGLSPRTISRLRQDAQREANVASRRANVKAFANAQEKVLLNMRKPKTAIQTAVNAGTAMKKVGTINRLQEKRAQGIIERLGVNTNTKLRLKNELKNASRRNSNTLSAFLTKLSNARKAENAKKAREAENAKRAQETAAAISIQAGLRGMKNRTRFKKMKEAENARKAEPKSIKKSVGTKRPRNKSPNPNAPSSKKPRNVKAELERMKVPELKIFAKEKGVKVPSKITKPRLIELLLAHKNKPNSPKNKPNSPKNQETLKNRKACEALFKVYISKITESKRAGIEKRAGEIIAQMMKYNIAFDQSAKSMNKMSNVSKTIDINDYFNVLLIMWLDGIHDKYVNTYFVDWYKTQIKSKILPSHHEQDIVTMATSIKENHTNVLIGVLQYLKEKPEYKNIYDIIIAGIQSSKELTTKGEVGSYSDVLLVQICGIANCPPDKKTRLMKINYLKRVLFDTEGNVKGNAPRPRPDTIQFPPGWEKSVKNFLVKYFKTSEHKSNTITLPGNEGLLLSIDQEYSSNQERPLTELIDNNTTTGLVTFGQALDPGSTMLPRLITQDLITMINPKPKPPTSNNGNSLIRTVNTSNVTEKKFIPNVKYYLNNFKFELKDNNGTSLFNLDLDPFGGGIPTLKFNGNVLTVNQSAGKAGKAGKEADKISKYFGDALQYLIFTNLSSKKFETVNKTRYPFLGSGDSMAMLGYTIFSEIVGTKPKMLIDFSESSDPIYHPVNLQPGAVFSNRRRVEATEGGRIIQ